MRKGKDIFDHDDDDAGDDTPGEIEPNEASIAAAELDPGAYEKTEATIAERPDTALVDREA